MSADLYQEETAQRVAMMPPVREPETGVFDGFVRGTGLATMRGLAKTGRAIDLLGSVGPITKDAFTDGTALQDKYFQEHDEVWGSAVDYWMPRRNEVGTAAEVVGSLLSTLPIVLASPSLAVGSLQLSTSEDLVKEGVDPTKAQAVGAVQGVGLGIGVWMPILGQNLWQRLVIGGAGANVAQGVGTRAASGLLLEGTPAAEQFKALDLEAMTLDGLLGLAFGGMAHLSPAMRAQGKEALERITNWAQHLTPTQVSALAALRQAQHLNLDSVPGKAAEPKDVEAHVERMRTALEQVVRDESVQVSDLPAAHVEPDPARTAEMETRAQELVQEAERIRTEEKLPHPPIIAPSELAGLPKAEGPAATPGGAEPPPPRGFRQEEAAGPDAADPWLTTPEGEPLQAFALDHPDMRTMLESMAENETGWAQIGGRRARVDLPGGVVNFTPWIPKAEWWRERPVKMNENQVKTAVRKHLAGEPLKMNEQRMIDHMAAVANERLAARRSIGDEEWARVSEEMKQEGLEPTDRNVMDTELVTRASEFDAEAVEAAAVKHENDDAAFMAEVRRIVDEAKTETTGKGAPAAGGGEARREAKGEERPDPVAKEAERYVAENPKRLVRVGTDAEGAPVYKTAAEYLEQVRADVARAQEDASLFEVAAQCMLGVL